MADNKNLHIGGLADISDSKRFELIHKTIIAGTAFRLDGSTTKIDQYIWDGWLSGFTATMHKDEYDQCEKFAILWSQDDSADAPEMGIPQNVVELGYLMKNHRIDRENVKIAGTNNTMESPSATQWNVAANFKNAEDFRVRKTDTQPSADATNIVTRRIIDAVVRHISSGYYEGTVTAADAAGQEALNYFAGAESIRKAMRKYRYLATRLLPVDMVEPFLDGYYKTHEVLIETLKRRYGLGKDQLLMTDHFKKMDAIIAENTPMEFKIGRLRSQINKLLIKKSADYPVCRDFPGHTLIQRYPEEYSPIVNTLLTFCRVCWYHP